MLFLQNTVNGISLGAIYALIALGYTMVYGIAKMLNFAHGDVIMIGTYVVYAVMSGLNMPEWAALLVAMVACILLGITVEALAYRPLRGAPGLAVLITAIGVSIFLQNSAQQIWGANPKLYPSAAQLGTISLFGGALNIGGDVLLKIVVTVAIMLALTFYTSRTRMGKAMRAVSEDRDAAALMGINVNRTIAVTFAIGSALAAVAGFFLWFKTPLNITFGAMPGIKAFTAAVLGGIGSMPGAMIGGILLGMIETYSSAVLSQYTDAIVFSVLVIILLVKPTGLLGKKIQEKV